MRAPAGRPPPGTAPPKQAPPAGPAPKVAASASASKATAPATNSNVPKAPPINWFFSWIKKEPFGDNVPLVANTTRNNMPEPIAKVEDNMSDDLDLSFISADVAAGKGNDPGDIFNENPAPKELTMAE